MNQPISLSSVRDDTLWAVVASIGRTHRVAEIFPNRQAALADRYRAGGMGYGEAKQTLFEIARDYFAAARERREKLAADPAAIQDILRDGAQRARAKAVEVLDRARRACGLRSRQG